jgi:hypothetical protein
MRYVAPGALQCRVEEIDGVRVHRKLLLSARGTKSASARDGDAPLGARWRTCCAHAKTKPPFAIRDYQMMCFRCDSPVNCDQPAR